ncbi:MAG: TRAP transporter large permease [Brachymonas sp.]|nr:TRAP transporter large permease [Brachymonas sp.]
MSLAFILCIGTMFLLAAIGAPIAYSIICAAVVYLFTAGQDLGIAGEQIIYGLYDSFVLLAVPLFIVAANIMNAGTISERLLQFCVVLVGRLKGGLGHVNIISSLIFSGMSGSAVADAAGIGKVIIGMMVKSGHYTAGYAAAITAASATIGPIIPPSIPMVLYALVSDASIGFLFLGGVLPGLLMGVMLMIMNAVICHRRGFAADAAPPWSELPKATVRAFPALLLPVILLFGIYGGATTPTEAAAVAAAYALLVSALLYRALKWGDLRSVMMDSVRSSASVGLVIGGALILNYIVASEGIPAMLAQWLKGMDVTPMGFMIACNLLLLALGCVLDASTIILVIVPLFLATCKALGIDLVYFGVVVVINCMIGLITPPYGVLLFVINGTTGIKLADMIREIWPFLIALLIALALMVAFPQIILWLPQQFGYVPTKF